MSDKCYKASYVEINQAKMHLYTKTRSFRSLSKDSGSRWRALSLSLYAVSPIRTLRNQRVARRCTLSTRALSLTVLGDQTSVPKLS